MEYTIAYGSDYSKLIEQVRQVIKLGFSPQGGVCVNKDSYYQAMIRE